ncbi:25913_t:CDS:1, partial [Racocetra persica]
MDGIRCKMDDIRKLKNNINSREDLSNTNPREDLINSKVALKTLNGLSE